MTTEENKIFKVLIAHGIEEDKARELLEPLKELDNAYPHLSDDEISQIAEKVAEDFVEFWGPPRDSKRWREDIRKVALQIAIGVTSSGIFALLVYLYIQIRLSFAPAEVDHAELLRQAEEKAKAVSPLSPITREKLKEESLTFFFFPKSFMIDIEMQVLQEKAIQEFLETIKQEYEWAQEPKLKTFVTSLVQRVHRNLVQRVKQKLIA